MFPFKFECNYLVLVGVME